MDDRISETAMSEATMSQLSSLVAERLGLDFPKKRWPDLARGIVAVARQLSLGGPYECVRWLSSSSFSRRDAEMLAGHLTVGETYFLRDKKTFEILEQEVLPALIRRRRDADKRLRLWSAGCCTGEEPYSLAIVLSRILPDISDWNIAILATDINTSAIEKAMIGEYGEWSFRDTPPGIRERYFAPTRWGRYGLSPEIKRMVTFSSLNLAEDSYPSIENHTNAMDIVICRNVLMYFTPERVQSVVDRFHNTLVDGGILFVSPSETSQHTFSRFETLSCPDVILYRKPVQAAATLSDAHRTFPFPPSLEAMTVSTDQTPPAELPAISTIGDATTVPEEDEKRSVCEPAPPPINGLERARALYAEGRNAEAERIALQMVNDRPEGAVRFTLLARICANEGRLVDALAWCDKAVEVDVLSPANRYLRATVLDELGDWKGAARALEQALYLDHSFVLAHFVLGNLERRLGRNARAKVRFQNALELLSTYPPERQLPESEGLTAGRLIEIVRAALVEGMSTSLEVTR